MKFRLDALHCFFIILFAGHVVAFAQEHPWNGALPQVKGNFGLVPEKFQNYDVILKPDQEKPQWWAGAPSVIRDGNGVFWLACRMRSTDQPRGKRGYEVRILNSKDGVHFTKVLSIPRQAVPIPGFERPVLLIDPMTKKFKLYLCGPWHDGPWSILKLQDVNNPKDFDPKSAYVVIKPFPKTFDRDITVLEYKDPYIIYADGYFHCYVTGYVRQNERLFHFRSVDGESWEPVGDPKKPIMDLSGWHDFFVRPGSVLPLGVGYLFFYEGSSIQWYDPVYNIATGVGFTFDLHHIIDLTPNSPLIVSTTPTRFYTWRYSQFMWVDHELWVYAEVATKKQTKEIRLFRIPIDGK